MNHYRCRLDWGRRGAAHAARRGDILVIVDVLSFSSAVVTAVECGASIRPAADEEDALKLLQGFPNAVVARRREAARDRLQSNTFSLSPTSFFGITTGTHVILPSPNGAACSKLAGDSPVVAGCLLNAHSAAHRAMLLAEERGRDITVLACGERFDDQSADGTLRFAIEDYLGAGAILSEITVAPTPEAELCRIAFSAAVNEGRLDPLIRESISGIELRDRGYLSDVLHALKHNTCLSAPVLRAGWYLNAE